MKLQTTLTFGLAIALFGAASSSFAVDSATPAPAYAAATPYAAPAYGQLPAAPAAPAVAAATPRPAYGYTTPPAGYSYPAAPTAGYPVAATPQPTAPGYQYPAYGQQPYAQVAAQPTAPVQQTPAAPVAAAPAIGLGGYPMAPVKVAQTLPAPIGSANKSVMQAPALTAPVEPVAPATPPAPMAAAPVETYAHPPTDSWTGYTTPPTDDCTTGGCAPAPVYESTGCDDCGAPACDLSVGCAPSAPSRQWFIGLYGLYLDRDDRGKAITAVEVQTPPGAGTTYYPDSATDRFLSTANADSDFRGGAEIRFGSTFGCALDPCTGCCYQPLAWELGYWAITDDPDQAVFIEDTIDADRIYGYKDYSGLQYDRDGAAGGTYTWRPLNDYYDYQKPVDGDSTNDVRVLGVRVRQNFEAQNLELNLWRFGSPGFAGGVGCGQACGVGGCGTGCGAGGCSDPCGYDTCGCAPCAAPKRFFISGLAGVRYFRMDETLQSAVTFGQTTVGTDPTVYPGGFPAGDELTIFDDIEIDNELIGFQLGCSLNRLVGCKWTLFADTNFGIYNNNVEKYQRVTGGGDVQFISTGGDAVIRADDNDIAFLGELRTGVAYQISCRARLTAAWRVIAASGIATAVGNFDTDFATPELASHIDMNDSLILHGLQAGIELKY